MGIFSQLGDNTEGGLRLGTAPNNNKSLSNSNNLNPRDSHKADDDLQASKTLEVLGFVSQNKELFLFEKPVKMEEGVEKWLVMVEQAM